MFVYAKRGRISREKQKLQMWRLKRHFCDYTSGVCKNKGEQRIVDVAERRVPDDDSVLIEKLPEC